MNAEGLVNVALTRVGFSAIGDCRKHAAGQVFHRCRFLLLWGESEAWNTNLADVSGRSPPLQALRLKMRVWLELDDDFSQRTGFDEIVCRFDVCGGEALVVEERGQFSGFD